MIDEKMIALVTETKKTLAGMADARPSERMAVKEDFASKATTLIGQALLGISDAHKIAFFNALARGEIEILVTEIEQRSNGDYCEDGQSDYEHGVSEEVSKAVFGSHIHKATNELEGIFEKD